MRYMSKVSVVLNFMGPQIAGKNKFWGSQISGGKIFAR